MKIGIMGGTFNPIHTGHLILAQQISEKLQLDKVIFVPCFLPPHKETKSVINPCHRLKMTELAISDNPLFEVSDMEITAEKVSYSINMIKNFKDLYPKAEIYFLIGEDSLFDLHTWFKINDMLKLCTFVTAKRSPSDDIKNRFIAKNEFFDKKTMEKLCHNIVQTNVVTLSSSEIREKIAKKESIKYIVPKDVEKYIKENNLY